MALPPKLPTTGFVRLRSIIAPHGVIPVSKSTWYAGIKSGRFPAPVRLSCRVSAWKVHEIQEIVDRLSKDGGQS